MIAPSLAAAVVASGSDAEMDAAAAVRIVEVVALEYPEDGFEYCGMIRAKDAMGATMLEQALQVRRRPEWLVNARILSHCDLNVTLLCRRYDSRRWEEVGQTTFNPDRHLQGSSATVELPLPGWAEAPDLKLRVRLARTQAEEARDRMPSAADFGRPSRAFLAREAAPIAEELVISLEEIKNIAPLSAPEQVIVKDIWNKLLAFQDLLVEMFFERLLHEAPELLEDFGDAVDIVPSYFAAMFDVAVRALNPHTERCLREAYRGIYPAPPEGYKTVGEYAELLADLGMRPRHWMTARRVWAWTLSHIPYLEDYDRENLAKGVHSAMYRFFTRHLLPPALEAIQAYDAALSPEIMREMRRCSDIILAGARTIGMEFYRLLFETHPDALPFFGRADIDTLSGHLMQSIAFLARTVEAGRSGLREMRHLSRFHTNVGVPPEAYPKIAGPMLEIMKRHVPDFTPELERAWSLVLSRVITVLKQPMLNRERLLGQAKEFLDVISREQQWEPGQYERRWREIEREVEATGAYTHTYEELAYGAQLAWRNASKCVGRIAWRNMIVRDLRNVSDPDAMFKECVEHLRMGTNGGNMQIVMNVFRPKKPLERWGPRIWNSQYIRFAAYEQEDGAVLGDPANLELTKAILKQGWTPPETKTPFDILPLVIEAPGHAPKMYEFAPEDVLTVNLEHPTLPEFASLGLKWCAIPAISNFRMDIGGIQYGCLPFNGWFMETEIARNLWEDWRYNKAEAIAQAMGLDTSSEQTLWRDRAFLELNVAVLHSFSKAKVTLVDHQTAAKQFITHDQREKRAGRECPAQWSWVVPPAGGCTTAAWHHEMRDFYLSPQFHYAADKWAVIGAELAIAGEGEDTSGASADRVLILYGSETGTAESFARQVGRRLGRYRPRVMALDEYEREKLREERLLLVVTSTFADGEMPGNAKQFYTWLQDQPGGSLDGLNYAVMALGSTVYPHFCAAGVNLDRELARLGGNRVIALHRGDEIKGQAETFRQWLELAARMLGEDPTSSNAADAANQVRLKITFLEDGNAPELTSEPARVRNRRVPGVEARVTANRELLKEVILGSRSTRFLAFDISGTDLTYETGDHVAIYPHNPTALVERTCRLLRVNPDARFTTSLVGRDGSGVEGDTAYPEPVTARQILTEDFDLSLRDPFDELMAALVASAQNGGEKERLQAWAETLRRGDEDEDCRALKKHLGDYFITLADLLEAFPSATPALETLIEILPRQKPRLYSISSCSLLHPKEIHVTVGVIQVTTEGGKTRQGLCSNYLASLNPETGATVRLTVRASNFRPPQDVSAPCCWSGRARGFPR